MIRPRRESLAFSKIPYSKLCSRSQHPGYALKPTDRLTKVLPTFRTSKIEGALISYQSSEDVSHAPTLQQDTLAFASEGVNDLLLETFFTLRETLVL